VSKIVIAPGAETCGCCEGSHVSTPSDLDNRMGLSAIAYRIGEYAQFKESMLSGLSSSEYAALAALRTRDADDFTLGLIDAVACAADVLTFYQERIANESYLRTATERVSLQEMARLIGYRLRPGVAAETWLAFALETPKTPPPGLSPEPGAFVTGIPVSLTLASGLKVQSVPGPDEKPQTFETVEEITARPEWNAIRPWLTADRSPGRGATDIWLQGVQNNLKPGDALVFAAKALDDDAVTSGLWDFRLIDSVDLDAAHDRTHVRWRGGLNSVSATTNPTDVFQVYALRTRAAVFGHNAPMWNSLSQQFHDLYGSDPNNPNEWPSFGISALNLSPITGTTRTAYVDLDAVVGGVRPGGLAVMTRDNIDRPIDVEPPDLSPHVNPLDDVVLSRTSQQLYVVTSTTELSRAQFALSGRITRLGLAGAHLADFSDSGAVRNTSIYLQSELLTRAAYPVSDEVKDDLLPLSVKADGLQPGRRLIVKGVRADEGKVRPGDEQTLVHEATVVSVQPGANGSPFTVLTITPSLPAALKRDTVVVHANVALATHGETVSQILGAGDASRSFQRFELRRVPLTYRSAASETGADSELTVRVGDIEWTEKPTMFGSAPVERAYTVSTDEQGKTWVVFGDGVHGSRLPSGVNNVRATYRQGLGHDGHVAADQLTQLMTRPLGLKSVSNPAAAEGGTDAEPADQARRTMPLGTRTLGRAVSLLDYEDFAMAFSGIAKARAQVLQTSAGPTIAITVAGQDGAALSTSNPLWNNLWLALKHSGDPHIHIALLSYQARTFRLGLRVKRDPAYGLKPLLAAVEAALRAHFAFDARSLAQPVLQSDVIARVHAVPGVVAVALDSLYEVALPAAQTVKSRQTRLLAAGMRLDGGVALPAELLTLDVAPLDLLGELA